MAEWYFLRNPFLASTESSYAAAVELSSYHDNALLANKSNAAIEPMYNDFHPLHVTLETSFGNWHSQSGLQQGDSLNLTNLLQELSKTKIKQWDVKIQNVYEQDSVQYRKLLPNRRSPFQKGTQKERMQNLYSFIQALNDDAAVEVVKTDAENFYAKLSDAYSAQKVSINTTKSQSDAVENARINVCIAMFANYGALIQKYAATPEKVAAYFNLSLLQRNRQSFFTGHIKPASIVNISKRTFAATNEVYINNNSAISLQFYLASNKNKKPTDTVLTLAPGEHTVPVQSLGDITNTYLLAYNPDENIEGSYEVEL